MLFQVLNRLTYASTLSHLRRLNSPIGREGETYNVTYVCFIYYGEWNDEDWLPFSPIYVLASTSSC